MNILILGAAGMIGRKLATGLTRRGTIGGRGIGRLVLADVTAADVPEGPVPTEIVVADLADPVTATKLIAGRPDVIFHLAAIVSGEAEADFEKGYRINLDGTRALLEAIRTVGLASAYRPRVVFTSSVAVFGQPLPEVVGDDYMTAPLTSYGTQKAIGELLLADYSRRGILDGIGIRLPTIVIRPGRPNRAASGFFSGIVREPLAGIEAVLPVGDHVRHWFASPRAAVSFLLHAAEIDTSPLGARRTLMMPGLSATVADEIAALTRIAGPGAARLIRREPDAEVARIIDGWPRSFDPQRALQLGFVAERSFDEIIEAYVEDELGGVLPNRT